MRLTNDPSNARAILTCGVDVGTSTKSLVSLDTMLPFCFESGSKPQEEIWVFRRDPSQKENTGYEKLMRQVKHMIELAPRFSPRICDIPIRTTPHVEIRGPRDVIGTDYCLLDKDVQVWLSRKIQIVLLAERLYRTMEAARRTESPSRWYLSGDTSDI